MRENNLSFVGATWYLSTSDAYLTYQRIQAGVRPREVCQGVEGYDDPCPGGKMIIFALS